MEVGRIKMAKVLEGNANFGKECNYMGWGVVDTPGHKGYRDESQRGGQVSRIDGVREKCCGREGVLEVVRRGLVGPSDPGRGTNAHGGGLQVFPKLGGRV